jgi:hypothetical protein
MAPKNIDVDEVNNAILESLSEELHTYMSVNSLVSIEGASDVQEFQWIPYIWWNF